MDKQTVMSLEERLERIKKGQAISPEAAAAKLKFIGNLPYYKLLHNANDINLLFENCGLEDYSDLPGVDYDYYYQFCRIYRYSLQGALKNCNGKFLQTEGNVHFVNAMFMLGSLFMDKLKEKDKNLKIYNALNMSLRDFWTAAMDTCVDKDGNVNWTRRAIMKKRRDTFMGHRDYDVPIKKELSYMLNQYMIGWELFGKLQEVLACDAALTEYLDREEILNYISDCDDYDSEDFDVEKMCECDLDFKPETFLSEENQNFEEDFEKNQAEDCEIPLEEDEEAARIAAEAQMDEYNLYMDPVGYFLNKLDAFKIPVEDFYSDDVKWVRDEAMFGELSYDPRSLKEMREEIKHKCFQEEFDKLVNSDAFEASYKICEIIAMRLYNLLVFPFLGIQNYHYDGPIDEKIDI